MNIKNVQKKPIVSIVLGSYNRLPFLKLTLQSVRDETKDLPNEIIVVDGGSDDGTMSYLEQQKDVITIIQHNRGEINGKPITKKSWGYFMNLGFKCAQGKYICMVSDDCLVVPNAIKNGIALCEKNTKPNKEIGALAFYFRDWPDEEKYKVLKTLGENIYVNHGLYLNKALKEVGYIDEENFDFYCADSDLCLKIKQAGYECSISPDSYIEHYSHANRAVRKSNSEKFIRDTEALVEKWKEQIDIKDQEKQTEKRFIDPTKTAEKFKHILSVNLYNKIYSKMNKLIYAARSGIPTPIKKNVRSLLNLSKKSTTAIKQKTAKLWRKIVPFSAPNTYHFAILCVKKTVYVDMIIANINSLHYLNPSHEATIYCDTLCFNCLEKNKNRLNYPEKVFIKNSFGESKKPWQYNKVETFIEASKNGQILTDADGVWHDDPIVDRSKITLLVVVNKIKDKPFELTLAQALVGNKNVAEFKHYVSGFVSLPPKFMTPQLETELRDFNDKIYSHPLNFISDQLEKDSLRRLSEELSISLSIQLHYSQSDITTLKDDDGPGSKQSLESLYYGCLNQVNE